MPSRIWRRIVWEEDEDEEADVREDNSDRGKKGGDTTRNPAKPYFVIDTFNAKKEGKKEEKWSDRAGRGQGQGWAIKIGPSQQAGDPDRCQMILKRYYYAKMQVERREESVEGRGDVTRTSSQQGRRRTSIA